MKLSTLLIVAGLFCISVHTTAQSHPRKKVGIVLSGGGAKGMAHIGALKVIEKTGIPIDYVVGTSMGSIIGGLYSIGYTPEQLDSMVRRQDWTFLLSDKIPRSEQNMAEREAAEKYVFSLPFGKNTKAQAIGGLIKGQNLANLFNELTIGYHDSIDFNKLPIPFACVSENIVNGNEVNFHKGYSHAGKHGHTRSIYSGSVGQYGSSRWRCGKQLSCKCSACYGGGYHYRSRCAK